MNDEQFISDNIKRHENLIWDLLHQYKMCEDQDAVSEAYDAAWKAIKDWEPYGGAKVTTLMHVYIYNALGSYLRKRKTRERNEVSIHTNVTQFEHGQNQTIEDTLVGDCDPLQRQVDEEGKSELWQLVDTYKQTLQGKRLQIFNLWIESEYQMSATDISATLGISQSYVTNELKKTKFQLGKLIKEAGIM